MNNPFIRHPAQLGIYDATTGNINIVILAGAAPTSVQNALRSVIRNKKTPSNIKQLHSFYGKKWAKQLPDPYLPPFEMTADRNIIRKMLDRELLSVAQSTSLLDEEIVGGADIDDIDMLDLSENITSIEIDPGVDTDVGTNVDTGVDTNVDTGVDTNVDTGVSADFGDISAFETDYKAPITHHDTGPTVTTTPVSDVQIYPDDTWIDIRNKIYSVTGIPHGRQHIFYIGIDGRIRITYRILIDNTPISIDIRELIKGSNRLAGIPIDTFLADRTDDIIVESVEYFQKVGSVLNLESPRIFVVDLFSILPERVKASNALSIAYKDKHTLGILYRGVARKYWPILASEDAFNSMISSSTELYPLLVPPYSDVVDIVKKQSNIVTSVYTNVIDINKQINNKRAISIVAATIAVIPDDVRTKINLRNMFDGIPPNETVLGSAYYPGSTGRGLSSRVLSSRVIIRKPLSTYLHPLSHIVDNMLTPSNTPSNTLIYIIKRQDDSEKNLAPFRIVFRQNGSYKISGTWREDARIGFNEVVNSLTRSTISVLKDINQLGGSIKYFGNPITPIGKFTNGRWTLPSTSFESLTVSAFLPYAFTTDAFNELKQHLRIAETADITESKGLQQRVGSFMFQFKRGITEYHQSATLGIVHRGYSGIIGRTIITNQFSRYINPTIASRWDSIFNGRTVHIFKRTTDLRIQIRDIGLDEFKRVYTYLNNIIKNAYKPDTRAIAVSIPRDQRLRRLKEHDPDLYDLQQSNRLYSVACQQPRQPIVYSTSDISKLPEKIRSKLTKWHNFTENRPAYYYCPDTQYPILGFRTGLHPLGYCLPCCRSAIPSSESTGAKTRSSCLQTFKWDQSIDPAIGSIRHVFTYGKPIPVGRLSAPPLIIPTELFYGVSTTELFRLIGVEQHLPAIPEAGMIFSICECLQLSIEELADRMIRIIDIGGYSLVVALGRGAGAVFDSVDDLKHTIHSSFISRDLMTKFSPGGIAADTWQQIIIDLVRYSEHVELVTFIDEGGELNVVYQIAYEVHSTYDTFGKVIILVKHEAGTYPMVLLNLKSYINDKNSALRIYTKDNCNQVITTLTDMLKMQHTFITIKFVLEFLVHNKKYQLSQYLLDSSGSIYGVMITIKKHAHGCDRAHDCDHDYVYFPVAHEYMSLPANTAGVDVSADVPIPIITIGPRPDVTISSKLLNTLINDFNKYVQSISRSRRNDIPSIIKPERYLAWNGKIIGFISTSGLTYYHTGISIKLESNIINLKYDPKVIDDTLRTNIITKSTFKLSDESEVALFTFNRYRSQYMQLVATFVTVLQRDRDVNIRKKIISAFKLLKYGSARFDDNMIHILSKSNDESIDSDVTLLHSIVTKSRIRNLSEKDMIRIVDNTIFDFDMKTVAAIKRAKNQSLAKVIVINTLKPYIKLKKNIKLTSDVDTIGVCAADSIHCDDGKMIISATEFDALADILAADIRNPITSSIVVVAASGHLHPNTYVTRPGERLEFRL